MCSGYTHTHTHLTALFPGLHRWAGTRKVKPIWILLKQETVSGSGISWDICKSAPHCRQITIPAPHHSVFYRPDALPAAQPTASKHWRHSVQGMHTVNSERTKVRISPRTVVFVANATVVCSPGHELHTFTAVLRSTQPCIPPGSLNQVPASPGV